MKIKDLGNQPGFGRLYAVSTGENSWMWCDENFKKLLEDYKVQINLYIMEETKKAAQKFIKDGGKCTYTYGWAYRGAGSEIITKEKALELLPKYSFGKGFWSLSWLKDDAGNDVLNFNELSENDMW